MTEQPNYYAIIPAIVRYDDRLKPIEKLMYGEITCLCNKEGYCFASNNYFGELYNCSERAIRSYLSNLQDCGYIKIFIEDNYKRKIFITPNIGGVGKFFPGGRKILSGGVENSFRGGAENSFHNNNTSINNINNISSSFSITTTNNSNIYNIYSLYEYIEQNFARTLSSFECQKVDNWTKDFSQHIVKYAVNIALMNNVKNLSYVEGILKNWKSLNLKNIKEIEEYQNNFKKKQDDEKTEELFEYNWLEDK